MLNKSYIILLFLATYLCFSCKDHSVANKENPEKPGKIIQKSDDSDIVAIQEDFVNNLYTNAAYRFSISFPENWTLSKMKEPVLISSIRPDSGKIIIILKSPLSVDITTDMPKWEIEKTKRKLIEGMEQDGNTVISHEMELRTFHGIPALYYVCTAVGKSKNKEMIELVFYSYLFNSTDGTTILLQYSIPILFFNAKEENRIFSVFDSFKFIL